MTTQQEKAERFLELHRPGDPLLLPNPWDQGSAKLLAAMGFQALATTSSGFAATLGRLDGSVSREEALGHAAAIVAATELPVSADLENGFADDPDGVARTIGLAAETGLAGCSVEDSTGDEDEPIYDIGVAAERVAAAVEAAHAGTGAPGADRPRRELPARAPGSGGHDHQVAGIPGGGRRRAVRTRPDEPGGHQAGGRRRWIAR